ncbi:hypothetical protein [Chitinophaga sp. ARDCPP14]|uniref:hypothetical protein n=1 Tax=Chitinophaga sp. ARDCPP14 TaxID=3391139 RepID=UPI003F5277C5
MTDKEFLIQACAEIEAKNLLLKRDCRKMDIEIKKLRKEIALQKKNGGLICSGAVNTQIRLNP